MQRLHARADAGAVDARPRIRDVRPLVRRGAVADVHEPVVLPRRLGVGLVVNAPYKNFPGHNTAETIFERLESKGLTWKVYVDPPAIAPVHGPHPRHRACKRSLRDPLRHHGPVLRGCRERRAADVLVHRAEPDARPQRHAPADRGAHARAWRSMRRPRSSAARHCSPGSTRRSARPSSRRRLQLVEHAPDGRVRRARRHLRPRPPPAGDAARPGRHPRASTGFTFDRLDRDSAGRRGIRDRRRARRVIGRRDSSAATKKQTAPSAVPRFAQNSLTKSPVSGMT